MKNKIYAIRNPIWLADKFIFSKMIYRFDDGKTETHYPYITINSKNKIEEIGTDITLRMGFMFHKKPIESIIDKSSEATKLQKSIYRIISKELWGMLISREQLNNNNYGIQQETIRRE